MSCSIWILSGSAEKLREQVRLAVEKEYPESEADIAVEHRAGTIPESLLQMLESSQKSMEEEVADARNAAPTLGNSPNRASATGQDLGTSSASGHVAGAAPSLSNSSMPASATGQDLGTSSASGHVAGDGRGLRGPPRIEVGLHINVYLKFRTRGHMRILQAFQLNYLKPFSETLEI